MEEKRTNRGSTPGERVREERLRLGFTQSKLGDKIGLRGTETRCQILSYVEKDRKPLSQKMAEKLSEVFGVLPDYLLCKTDCRTEEEREREALRKMFAKADKREQEQQYILFLMSRYGIEFENNDPAAYHSDLMIRVKVDGDDMLCTESLYKAFYKDVYFYIKHRTEMLKQDIIEMNSNYEHHDLELRTEIEALRELRKKLAEKKA